MKKLLNKCIQKSSTTQVFAGKEKKTHENKYDCVNLALECGFCKREMVQQNKGEFCKSVQTAFAYARLAVIFKVS